MSFLLLMDFHKPNTRAFLIPGIFFLLIFLHQASMAEVKLPRLVGDHMILQRDKQLPVWGWAEPGEVVQILFRNQNMSAKADADGKWQIILEPEQAGGPYDMVISGKNEIRIKDIMIGDVWICSGQSNMEWKMGMLREKYASEISSASNNNIRQVEVEKTIALDPLKDIKTSGWKAVTPENVVDFTAVGYFFAKDLYEQYKVPIGLIYTTWGGTVAEAWMSPEALLEFPEFKEEIENRNSGSAKMENEEYERQLQAWNENINNALQKNKSQGKDLVKVKYDDREWKTMALPTLWEQAGLKDFDGIVWFRKIVEIPKDLAGKDILISLGAIDDADSTIFNGQPIGSTSQYNTFREYKVPGNRVVAGKNVIAIRVVDTGGGGGLFGNKEDMYIKGGDKQIPLHGDWKYKVAVDFTQKPKDPNNPNKPAVLFNGMIAPIIPFAVKGVIWYQGESNTGRAAQYQRLFPALIEDWRINWRQREVPFLFVQLANYMEAKDEPSESNWAELREAQLKTLAFPKTGMAVIIDIGEAGDIHPKNKQDVGKRLALAARKVAYDEDIVHSGPIYESMEKAGNTIRIKFKNVGGGLTAKGGDLQEFTIAGPDKKFYRAKAVIENNEVIVSSEKVPNPVAVRYAWADNPENANLYNKEGLPASPFRTDKF